MSDTSTSNEVGKNNLLENYDGEIVNPVFYALDINLDKLKDGSGNPNSSTSGVVEVLPREAGELEDIRLVVGVMPPVSVPVVNISADKDKARIKAAISQKAKQTGGIGLNEGGVVEFKTNPEKYNNQGREL